jgi:hypothetical protein
MTRASRQSKKRAGAIVANRNVGVVLRGFAFLSWNRASCLRRKTISASSVVREEKNSRMKVSNPALVFNGRGGAIRTPDPLRPRQVRYQAALRPD